MTAPSMRRYPTGLGFIAPYGAAVLELFWCCDRGVWLCGPVRPDGAVKYAPDPVGLPAPAGGPDGVDENDAQRIACGWFGVGE